VVVAPPATERASQRTIDFYVVDSRLEGAVCAVGEVTDFPSTPHLPVRLEVRGHVGQRMRRILVRGRDLPQGLPQGCSRRPPAYSMLIAAAR